jgi:hypothetical protein
MMDRGEIHPGPTIVRLVNSNPARATSQSVILRVTPRTASVLKIPGSINNGNERREHISTC